MSAMGRRLRLKADVATSRLARDSTWGVFVVSTFSKIEVAQELLERALALFLDDHAFVPAIVLAGAAEDVFHGYLQRAGAEPARVNFARSASRISKHLNPAEPEIPEQVFVQRMRDPFNWLRHADDPSDPDNASWDFEVEAEHILSRAIENMGQLLSDYPTRVEEFSDAMRTRMSRRDAAY